MDFSCMSPEPIVIGNDVWTASDICVKLGARIGDGAVIAMRSLVTRAVSPYVVEGGAPAEIIWHRFTDTQTEALLRIGWNSPDARILEMMPLLLSNNGQDFIDAVDEHA